MIDTMDKRILATRIPFFLLVLAITLLFPQTVLSNGETTHVYVDPDTSTATTCGTHTIEIKVEDAVDLTGYHLEIYFDETVVQVTEVVNGGFLDGDTGEALYEPTNEIDNVNGFISFGMAQQNSSTNPLTPKSGDGSLIEITLQALVSNETSAIEIDSENSILVDWPDASAVEFTATDGVVNTESCPPTAIELSKALVPENEPVGTEVGVLTSNDPDSGDSFTYSLVDDAAYPDNLSFSITGDRLLTNEIFDYEVKPSYIIKVRSTDAGGQYLEQTFTIDIDDVDENPIAVDDTYSTLRNEPLSVEVPGVLTNDSDPEGGSIVAIKMSSPPSEEGVVVLGQDGDLLYDPPEDWTGTTSFTYRVYDGGLYSTEATVTIHVNDSNQPPTDITLSGYTIPENEPSGTEVGTFVTVDPDVPHDSFIYELVSGEGDDDNAFFEIVGSSLRSGDVFNYEEKYVYSIRVRSTDQGGETIEKVFTIFVTDVNDPPVAYDQDAFTEEETPVEIILPGFDEDGDDLEFEIVSVPAEGLLSGTPPNLTYTPGDDFIGTDSFTFRVYDGQDYSESATVNIIIDEKKGIEYYFPFFMNEN